MHNDEADAMNPKPGMIVASRHATILQRHVRHVSESNIRYHVPAKNSGWWERNCLPSVWRRWCREHNAVVKRADR